MAESGERRLSGYLPADCGRIYIGYSGGVDSQVLLHWAAAEPELRARLSAVHVHHGLQAAADEWLAFCARQCADWRVDFQAIRVDARARPGESPEAAARAARYAALRPLLRSGDVLLLAQHREDQLETVLLQLARGGGLAGLAAMPVASDFGAGRVLRPLLDWPKSEVLAYAGRHALRWVEDPSNADDGFDRNFLRMHVIPLLKQRWPRMDKTVSRSAEHCAAADRLLNACLSDQLSLMLDDGLSLCLRSLSALEPERQAWVLRLWLRRFGLQSPAQARLRDLLSQMLIAREDALPEWRLGDRLIRRYRARLYCLPASIASGFAEQDWPAGQAFLPLSNGYRLAVFAAESGIGGEIWRQGRICLRRRRGGETLQLPRRDGSHNLKRLFQEAATPPWEREARPLLYIDGRLAAVAGLWVAGWAWRGEGECFQVSWERELPVDLVDGVADGFEL